jgi:hypothetical protein
VFLYDILGILLLVFTGAFLLFLPLAAAGLIVWAFGKVKWFVESHRGTLRQV